MTCTIFNTKGLGASSESFSDGKGNLRYDPEQLKGQFTGVAATPHPILWDVTGPILLLGSWCEPSLAQFSNVTYAVLPNRWEDRSGIALAEAHCWDVYVYLIPQLAKCLNRIHGTHHSVSYWEFLLAPWFLDTVHALYDRYLLACDARQLAPRASLTAPAGRMLPPSTTLEALERFVSDSGNLIIFSLVFRELGLEVVESRNHQALPRHVRSRDQSFAALSLFVKQLVHRWLARSSGMRVLVSVPHIGWADTLWLMARVPGLRVPIQSVVLAEASFSADWTRRDALRQLSSRSEFERMIVDVLPDLVPATFVENYSQVVSQSYLFCGGRAVPVVFTYFHEPLIEFVARSKSVGCTVSMYQHGGGYGQYRTYPMERHHVVEGHTFLSWGWQGPNVQSLPSPHLSRIRNSHCGGDSIVLVEVCMPKYVYRFHSKPICQQDRLIAHMVNFIESLPERVKAKVVLKPVPGFERYEMERPPVLEQLRQWPERPRWAYQSMRTARLAVVTYPETTFIEALTLNVPTIGLWDFSLYEMRQEAQPYFEALEKNGIIYSDPYAAGKKVAEVYDQATSWWASEEVQSARLLFLEQFGLASRDWQQQWASYLKMLARS